MKTIVFLMDSLNRRYLPVYGNDWARTLRKQLEEKEGVIDVLKKSVGILPKP